MTIDGIPLHTAISIYQQAVTNKTEELLKAFEGMYNPLAGMGYNGVESMRQHANIKTITRELKLIKLSAEKIEKEISNFYERNNGR